MPMNINIRRLETVIKRLELIMKLTNQLPIAGEAELARVGVTQVLNELQELTKWR